MTWHFLDKILDEASKQSTLVGKVWVVVIFIFRIVVLSKIGEPLYADEQAAFKCNTRQPGCENVCFNLFSPISHPRFWGLQILFSAVPSMIYIIYAAHITSKYPSLQKPKKTKKRKRKKRSKHHSKSKEERIQELERETVKDKSLAESYAGYRRARKVFKSVVELPRFKNEIKHNRSKFCRGSPQYSNTFNTLLRKEPTLTKRLDCVSGHFHHQYNKTMSNKPHRSHNVTAALDSGGPSPSPTTGRSCGGGEGGVRIEKHFSSNLRQSVFPRVTSFSMKSSNHQLFESQQRGSSLVHECDVIDPSFTQRHRDRTWRMGSHVKRQQNIIMEYVRLSEISSGKITHTNSINSYRVTRSFGKRTVSFASTNRFSDFSQRRFSSKNYFFGPVETSSPIPQAPFTAMGRHRRLRTMVQSNNHLMLPSSLPSTILAEPLAPLCKQELLADPGKHSLKLEEHSRRLPELETTHGARTASNNLKILRIERRIEAAYFVQSIMRFLVEGGFLMLQYMFFDFNVPTVFRCERSPCPNTVDCFISRPQEKTIMLWFMFGVSVFCVTLSVYELFIMIRRLCWRVFHDSKTLSTNADESISSTENAVRKKRHGWCARKPEKFLRLRSITLIAKEEEEAITASTATTSSSDDDDDSDKSIDSKALSSIYDNDQSYDIGSFNDGADDYDQQVQEDIQQVNHDVSLNSF